MKLHVLVVVTNCCNSGMVDPDNVSLEGSVGIGPRLASVGGNVFILIFVTSL